MKLGCCVPPPVDGESKKRAMAVIEAGFDYIETGLSKLVAMGEDKIDKAADFISESGIPCRAVNLFLPADLKVVGNDADFDKIRRYLEVAFPAAKRLGVLVIVFGSGGARLVPPGFSKDIAQIQLISFLRLAAGYCEDYDIDIAVEPLASIECNLITSVKEGLWLAKYAAKDRIKLLADYYHMMRDNESAANIIGTENFLIHTHTAARLGRKYPQNKDFEEQKAFFDALFKIGYQGGVSIEGKTDNFDNDIKEAFALLDSLRSR